MSADQARQQILAANQLAADGLRARFAAAGTLVVNLISSPGSGKTTLLAALAQRLGRELALAAIVGDVATERDAERLRAAGLPAHQIVTGGACHLDARMVERALQATDFGPLDLLFIENVGNLVCPAGFDLGEAFKIVLLSVTEGTDKPFKYPGIFSKADLALLTKWDLHPHVCFDAEAVEREIAVLRPSARVLRVSAEKGSGLAELARLLRERVESCKQTIAS